MQRPAAAGLSEPFRPDIEGLRGIAVLLVVLYHAGVVGLPGGFVGVDVFFVISGFLITGLLVRERETTGTVRLQAFYARRVRRLLPAGIAALAVTLFLAAALLNPLDRPSAALDAAAAALSIGNIRFAVAAGDYFASVAAPSPFLHFWSLGVEEQFYLLWPAVVLLAARLGPARLAAGVALAGVTAASLVANLVVTDAAPSWAFYSLPTRAWQLGLGGLLAVAGPWLGQVPARLRVLVGWTGLVAILVAALTIDGSLAYPGAWALLPTLGAADLILAGLVVRGPGALLAARPLRFLGRISYSLYLWHWPILVLPAAAIGTELPPAIRAALVAGAILAAWGSWRYIEEPFRVGMPSLARHPLRTIGAGGVAVSLLVSSAGGLAAAERLDQGEFDGESSPVAAATAQPATSSPGADSPGSRSAVVGLPNTGSPGAASAGAASPGATALSGPALPWSIWSPPSEPDEPLVVAASPEPTAAPAPTPRPTPTTYVRLPANVRPSLGAARDDKERLWSDGCLAIEAVTTPRDCAFGPADAAFTVALVGDSHASQWFPAVAQVADAHGWRILTAVKVACPFVDIPIYNVELKREYRECTSWNQAVLGRLNAKPPDLTIVSMSRYAIHPIRSADVSTAAQVASFSRMVARIPGRVTVLMDTPDGGRDVPACLAAHTSDVRACAIPSDMAFANRFGELEKGAAAETGASLLDLTDRVCVADPCPVVLDGMIVFRDLRHLTATFAGSLAPELDRQLETILAPPAPAPSPASAPVAEPAATPDGGEAPGAGVPEPWPLVAN